MLKQRAAVLGFTFSVFDIQVLGHVFQVWSLSFWLLWWGSIVHVISRNSFWPLTAVDRVDLILWPLSPIRGLCTLMWMHLFINLSPMGPLSHVSSSLQVGWVLRLGFAVVGWFRRFRLPPPPLVWFRFHRPPVGVCSSLFFCVPLFSSWLSYLHLIFIVISLSLSFHHICPAVAGRVCVCACVPSV